MAKKEEGPDQPRSWAIAFAGFVINSLLSGISRTTGIFYVALIETYGVSRMEANMPFTMRNVVRNLAGPLAGAIGQRYGARDVTFVGGIFAFLGIALCSYAPNVTWIIILWGGMHGFGVALGNTLFPVIVNQYFLKYRATASGFSLAGACIGSFIFPTVMEYILNHLGLSATFLITGGFAMHVLPAAILMVEPSWIQRAKRIEKLSRENNNSANKRSTSDPQQKKPKLEMISEDVEAVGIKKISSTDNICDDSKNKKEDDLQMVTTRGSRVFSRSGVDNPGFVGSNTDISKKNVGNFEAEIDVLEGMHTRTISIGETSLIFTEKPTEVQETSIRKGIALIIRDPMFYVISTSLAGFAMVFDPAITVIVDYIKDKGLQEDDAKYFISMMSFGDLLGRLCFGWVTDKNYMSLSKFMLLIQVIQGICFLLLPLFYNFDVLLVLIMIYGLASGATLVMYPILISKYLASVQALAVGFVSIATGILSFSIPPLIGYFRDNIGSYDGMFIMTGGLSVAVGVLWLFEPLFVRLQKSQHSTSITINT